VWWYITFFELYNDLVARRIDNDKMDGRRESQGGFNHRDDLDYFQHSPDFINRGAGSRQVLCSVRRAHRLARLIKGVP